MNVLIGLLTAVHVLVALVLIILVLMQKSSEQGIGAAFGGGVTETVFGGGTTTALVRMTIWCACIMLGSTLVLAVLHARHGGAGESLMQRTLQSAPMPAPVASQPPNLPLSPAGAAAPSEAKPQPPALPSSSAGAPTPGETKPQPPATQQPEAPKTP